VRERIGARVMFPHRYITRPVGDGENHIALTHDEFLARMTNGLFSLHWESHELRYGIGIEVDAWLSRGLPVKGDEFISTTNNSWITP
jgi:ribose 1,5-bisphosphokinase